jgi:phytoene synthase
LLELIDARAFDLHDQPMRTYAQLDAYCRRTSGNLFAAAAHILDAGAEPASTELAAQAGSAVGLTGLLRAFALHASRRQLYVPLEVLGRHHVDVEDIYAGQGSPGLLAALADVREQVRKHVAAVGNPQAWASTAVPAILPIALVPLYLGRMERPGYDPFRTAIEVPQWRRQWALWRAARRR